MIHLDTNYLVFGVVPGSTQDANLRLWLSAGEQLGVSAMAWAEFMCGPLRPTDEPAAVRLVGQPIPIDAVDAVKAAELFNLAGRRRGSLADCLIAAVALRAGAALATDNRADFARSHLRACASSGNPPRRGLIRRSGRVRGGPSPPAPPG